MGLSSDPLLAFINARLLETEATAKFAEMHAPSPWHDRDGIIKYTSPSHSPGGPVATVRTGAREHIALHDPRAVLADVAAKRKILALHRPDDEYAPDCAVCSGKSWSDMAPWPCPTVRTLASAWAWHPGWREEWGDE